MMSNTEAEDDKPKTYGMVFDPAKFADSMMAYDHQESFDEYIELRVQGVSRELALIEAFDMIRQGIDLGNINKLAFAADLNPYVKQQFRKVLASKDIKRDLWSEHMAVNRLLELVNDSNVRDTTRLNAITALNVLCGYIQLDEATSRRVGHSLADFARMNAAPAPAEEPEAGGHQVH
jgi:hypothetical protein